MRFSFLFFILLISSCTQKDPIIIFDNTLTYPKNLNGQYEPKPISKDSAKIAIDTLFYFAKTCPKLIGISLLSNYVIDYESLRMVLDSDTTASLRIYPALWPLGNGTRKFKFTLILAKEVNGTIQLGGRLPNGLGDNSKPDDSIYEYIIPCPPRCKDDFYKCDEWIKKLNEVGVDTSEMKCLKSND